MRQFLKISIAAAAVLLAASCQKENSPVDEPEVAVLAFEGEYWDALIDSPQYGGPLLYGEYDEAGFTYLGTDYSWHDQDNTELASELCESNGAAIYWNGGHAVSNYTDQAATTDYAGHSPERRSLRQQLLRTQRI